MLINMIILLFIHCDIYHFIHLSFYIIFTIKLYNILFRVTYLRERFNGDFGVGSFVMAQVISVIPGVFLIALFSSIPVVFMARWLNFDWFLLIMFLSLMTAEGYMALLSAIVPHFIIGMNYVW